LQHRREILISGREIITPSMAAAVSSRLNMVRLILDFGTVL
jgi:hypothetical protein